MFRNYRRDDRSTRRVGPYWQEHVQFTRGRNEEEFGPSAPNGPYRSERLDWSGDPKTTSPSRNRDNEGHDEHHGWSSWSEPYEGLGGTGWHEGMEHAMHRAPHSWREGPFAGKGPRNYKRGDDRIAEDINERLTLHGAVDATDIVVRVQHGEVTLSGNVMNKQSKRLAEDIAESVSGVSDVNNQIRITPRETGMEHETAA